MTEGLLLLRRRLADVVVVVAVEVRLGRPRPQGGGGPGGWVGQGGGVRRVLGAAWLLPSSNPSAAAPLQLSHHHEPFLPTHLPTTRRAA